MEELKVQENYPFFGHIDNIHSIDLKEKCIIIKAKEDIYADAIITYKHINKIWNC